MSRYWDMLPGWLKGATFMIGLPALIASFFWGPAFLAFGAIAALQAAFIARAYWRHDL